VRRDAADVDDRSAAGRNHVTRENLAGLEHGLQVDRQHAVPIGVRCVQKRAAGVYARTVDQDVGPAGLLQGLGQQVFDRIAQRDVDRAIAGPPADAFERLDAGLAAFLGQVGHDDMRAGSGQPVAQRAAQHARTADHHGRLAA